MNNFKKIMSLVVLFPFYNCGLKVSGHYVSKIRSADIKEISRKILEAYYDKRIDSSIKVNNIPDEAVRQELSKLKISYVTIYFKDSVMIYGKSDNHLSIRLYRYDKETVFYYDFANNPRDLARKKEHWDSGDIKIGERLYINKSKSPGIR